MPSLPIDLAPDVQAIARRLGKRAGLSVLSSSARGKLARHSFVACEPAALVRTLDPLAGDAAKKISGPWSFAPRFIGVLPFEAFRSLERPAWSQPETRPEPFISQIEWLEYDSVIGIDHQTGEACAVGRDDASARRLKQLVESSPDPGAAEFRFSFREDEPGSLHVERVRAAIEKIFAGDLYQVNLARRFSVALDPCDTLAALALLAALEQAFPSPFGALISCENGARVVASTPELLLDATPSADSRSWRRLATEPIKGTRRRDADSQVDERLARELDADPKERAELAMIIDVERNDLAKVSIPGSVHVEEAPHVVSHSTVHHRVARIISEARRGVSREQVLRAMVPSGSVTGAPKVRAMELIAELEPVRRGLYTGAFGTLGHDGSLRLAMAIRTLVVSSSGEGEYFSGGGIVESSDPARELEETHWKAAQLERLQASGLRPEPEPEPEPERR